MGGKHFVVLLFVFQWILGQGIQGSARFVNTIMNI